MHKLLGAALFLGILSAVYIFTNELQSSGSYFEPWHHDLLGASNAASILIGYSFVGISALLGARRLFRSSTKHYLEKREANYAELVENIARRKGWDAEMFSDFLGKSDYSESIEAYNKIREIDAETRRQGVSKARFDLVQLRRLLNRTVLEIEKFIAKYRDKTDGLEELKSLTSSVAANVGLINSVLRQDILFELARAFIALGVLCGLSITLDFLYLEIFGQPLQLASAVSWGFGSVIMAIILSKLTLFGFSKITELSFTHFDDLALLLVTRVLPYAGLIFGLRTFLVKSSDSPVVEGFRTHAVSLLNLTPPLMFVVLLFFVGNMVALFTWRHFVVQGLRLWARRTHQKFDDVFVEIISWIGNLLIVTIFYSVFVNTYVDDQSLKDVLNQYAIGFLIFSALMGYAGKETIENFFSGLVLQVDRPFELGDRLVIPSGEICDVKEIGMRSVTLYDVLANTELSVPNTLLSSMIITNISRPDSQLRIRIPIYVGLKNTFPSSHASRDYDIIAVCEAALVFISYFEPEISLALTFDAPTQGKGWDDRLMQNADSPNFGRRREQISVPLNKLKDQYFFKSDHEAVDQALNALQAFEDSKGWRTSIQARLATKLGKENLQLDLQMFEENLAIIQQIFHENIGAIWKQIGCFGDLEKKVLRLKGMGQLKSIRSVDLEPLMNEMQREPAIHSSFSVSPSGDMFAEVTLNCYANHLERRYEVTHLVNRYVECFFKGLGIEYSSSKSDSSIEQSNSNEVQ